MYKKFAVLILVDLTVKFIVYGWRGLDTSNILQFPSFFLLLLFLEWFFFVPIYALLLVFYRKLITFIFKRSTINKYLGLILTIIYCLVVSIVIYQIWFQNEWPLHQIIAYFMNALAVGVLFWLLFYKNFEEESLSKIKSFSRPSDFDLK